MELVPQELFNIPNFPKILRSFVYISTISIYVKHFFIVLVISGRAFTSTRIYRELKLRSSILTEDRQLKVLPKESVISLINGVWNLSSDQGNLGAFVITDVRVVWYANMNEHFNISIPYIQIASVRTRDSKFGVALVIESSQLSGGYILGFRVDPTEKLDEVAKEISSLHKVYSTKPIVGVEYQKTSENSYSSQKELDTVVTGLESLNEIDDGHPESTDAFSAYVAEDGQDQETRKPVYCPQFGLSIEELREGYTLEGLWQILPAEANKKYGD